ncbi:hypothetical protein TcasGA2_TC016035 [Tribolium castaneum]|uniref:Uncharacterized protein n=1 Tax=Tribolium castaneum TaxID=7070 RepID=D7EKL6_TRICA|nr:hypothetical protein TcasGA2_TC016035 [Tribolium castaneum]
MCNFSDNELLDGMICVVSVQRKSVVGDDLRSTTFAVSAYSVSGELHDSETCGIVERSASGALALAERAFGSRRSIVVQQLNSSTPPLPHAAHASLRVTLFNYNDHDFPTLQQTPTPQLVFFSKLLGDGLDSGSGDRLSPGWLRQPAASRVQDQLVLTQHHRTNGVRSELQPGPPGA